MALFAGIEGEGERFRRPRSAVSAEDDLGFLLNLSGVPKNFLFSSAIETYFGLMELWPIFGGHNLSTICAAFSFEIYKKWISTMICIIADFLKDCQNREKYTMTLPF